VPKKQETYVQQKKATKRAREKKAKKKKSPKNSKGLSEKKTAVLLDAAPTRGVSLEAKKGRAEKVHQRTTRALPKNCPSP